MDPTPTPTATDVSPSLSPPAETRPAASTPGEGAEVDPATLAVEVERPGGRAPYVPLAALKEERERANKFRDEGKQTAAEVATLKQQLESVLPIVQAVRANPAVLGAIQNGRVPDRVEPTQEDKDAAEMAEILSLYRPDGSLDLAGGKRALAVMDRRAGNAVQPVARNTQEQAAEANLQRAIAARDAKGRPYARQETMSRVFHAVPAHLAADPQVAQVLVNQARAEDAEYIFSTPLPPTNPPIFSEAPGGRVPQDEGMSEIEQRAARDRGVSQKDWQDTLNRPGGLWAPFKE